MNQINTLIKTKLVEIKKVCVDVEAEKRVNVVDEVVDRLVAPPLNVVVNDAVLEHVVENPVVLEHVVEHVEHVVDEV